MVQEQRELGIFELAIATLTIIRCTITMSAFQDLTQLPP
jgi:hypothetical protein